MFSALNTTVNLRHVTPLPPGTTFSTAISKLQDHDLLIHLDPELAHYETLPPEPEAPNTKRYKVTDHMHTLPKGLWDTTVTFESQITNTETGVNWVILAPLGLVQKTAWKLVKSEELDKMDKMDKTEKSDAGESKEDGKKKEEENKSEWFLVEDVEINASRLLVGTVKSKCEESWEKIHGKFVGHLQGVQVAVQA